MLGHYSHSIGKLEGFLKFDDCVFNSRLLIDKYFKSKLINSNDGHDLILADLVKDQNGWIDLPTNFIKGHDFVNVCKLRVNALPTRTRLSRGSPDIRMCNACNSKTETLYHVIQGCPRTHGARVKRHDNLVKFIAKRNINRGKQVIIEPRINTAVGLGKPDLVLVDGTLATVVDVQVTGNDNCKLENFNKNKMNYYRDNPDVSDYILDNLQCTEVEFVALTIHYKGLI